MLLRVRAAFFIAAAFLFFAQSPAMAQRKVSDLSPAGTLTGTEKTIVSKAGDTSQSYYTTPSDLKTYLFGSTGQTGLNSVFKNATATTVAPITAQCTGSGDESALLSAVNSNAGIRPILLQSGCVAHNKLDLAGKYVSFFGWPTVNNDITSMQSSWPRLTWDHTAIAANSDKKAFIDMNGTLGAGFDSINIIGTGSNIKEDDKSSFIVNSSTNGACCSTNKAEFNKVNFSEGNTFIGAAYDSGIGDAPNDTGGTILARVQRSQISNFVTAFTGNLSDLQLYNSELSGGRYGVLPNYGGGNNQISNNRFEYVFNPIWFGNPANTGWSGGSYINNNNFTNSWGVDIAIEDFTGYTISGNTFDGMQGTSSFTSASDVGILTNGGLSSDRDWSKGTGWTISGGVANASSSSASLCQYFPLAKGYTYNTQFTATNTGGTVAVTVGGTAGTTRSSNGTFTESIVAGDTNRICITGTGFSGTIDNIGLVRNLAPSIILGRVGKGPVRNVSIVGNNFAGSSHLKNAVTLNGGGTDGIVFLNTVSGSAITDPINLDNEVPTRMFAGWAGAYSGGGSAGFLLRGGNAGFGSDTYARTAAIIDAKGSQTVSKYIGLPVGTTAQRPTCDSTAYGGVRYNSSTGQAETCGANGWQIGSAAASTAYSIGNSGAAFTISLANGLSQYVTLTGNATITMPTVVAGGGFDITLLTGAGGFTPTFTGAKWAGGTAPTFTSTASRLDHVGCLPNYNLTAWECAAQLDVR